LDGTSFKIETRPPQGDSPPAGSFFSGRGELASLVRERDWSLTTLGPIEQWPQSLRSVVNILLTSRYAMWMGWGDDLTFLYNDAYRPTLGIKHPWALGAPAKKVWAEIWRDIGPRIETVLSTGQATYDEGLLLFLERSGFPEETYHTFSYSPLADDNGRINGMLCVVTEETERIISQRRMTTLGGLAAKLGAANTEVEVCAAVEQELGANTKDLPFTLTYLFQPGGQARLACATGIAEGQAAAPRMIDANAAGPWQVSELLRRPAARLVDDLTVWAKPLPLPSGVWDKSVEQASVVPIKGQSNERPAGFLVVGLNPYRRYDASYAGFVELVAGQVAAGIASARAYEEERRRADALAELDRAKTTFFSNVSHEFRTPLTLMLGPVEDLLSAPDPELTAESRDLLQVVQRNGLRLQRLVNALLDFSRIEAGRSQANYEPTDLAALTIELASSFRSAIERAGLEFIVDCRPLSRHVSIDREMWEKVVLNLLSNAFKYTFEGSITVKLLEHAETVELAVTDTGVGIPESELPHLFERFHRVEGTRGRTLEGSGIGLALVQELVKLHGGGVGVTSTLGAGSTFTVSLPFGAERAPAERSAAASTAVHTDAYVAEALRWLPAGDNAPPTSTPAGVAQSRVLLADDNADMRDYVQRLLGARYQVTAVSDGQQALASALAQPPDLVLTDVMMPELDGFGLLRALRDHERTRTLPILLLSARAGEESRVEGLDAGADDYLVKPFTARELMARVEAHLSLARMRRQADEARKVVADELRRKNDELTKANRELEEFAYVASHDLQEPLRMVNIYTELLLRQDGFSQNEDCVKYADFVHKGVLRMEELIKDLLNYSRVVHPDQDEPGSADLNLSLDQAMTDLRIRIEESGAAIICREPLPVVWGEERQLALVFLNLLSNALKYRRADVPPRIEIASESRDGECIVTVKDNGIGFQPQHAVIIFGLFKRLFKDAYPGTGLGLAISKRIVERYGGRIWAVSDGEGSGAAFSFALRTPSESRDRV